MKFLGPIGVSRILRNLRIIYQRKLVSGTDIKTINHTSLLGSGDLTINAAHKIVNSDQSTPYLDILLGGDKVALRIDLSSPYSGGGDNLYIGSLILSVVMEGEILAYDTSYYFGDAIKDLIDSIMVYYDESEDETHLYIKARTDNDGIIFTIYPMDDSTFTAEVTDERIGTEVKIIIPEVLQDKTQVDAAIGKRGVVSQTQTWSGVGSNPRTYVMREQVYGIIPQSFIDLVTSAGATFNATSGYFELNGLTDISYEEMRAIYTASIGAVPNMARSQTMTAYSARATLPLKATTSFPNNLSNWFYSADGVEEVNLASVINAGTSIGNFSNLVYGASKLRAINGEIRFAATGTASSPFYHCYSLRSVTIKGLACNISFKDSPNFTPSSVAYMINNAGTGTITITLHATAYAAAMADADVTAALAAHTNVSLAIA